MKKIYIIALLFLGAWQANSQDVHFTYFEFSPLLINPALTGAFEGSYRISGIYRDQDLSITSGRYTTPNFTVDLPVVRGFRKQDWIGIGITVFQDNSSEYNLKYFKSSQSLAYHLAIDKKQNSILSIGVQQGAGKRRVLPGDRLLNTETKILSSDKFYSDPDLGILEMDGKKINDWTVGATYRTYLNKTNFLRFGLSVGRIYRENQSITSLGSNDIQRIKYVLYGEYDFPITNRLYLNPQMIYQRTSNNQELSLQGEFSYWLNAEKDLFINAGLGYRVGDAVQILLGADYKNWKFGLAYDINANRLIPATRTFGAVEFGITYVGMVVKKPKVDPTVVCPRL